MPVTVGRILQLWTAFIFNLLKVSPRERLEQREQAFSKPLTNILVVLASSIASRLVVA